MEAAINYGLCRCCASEGSFKDLEKTYDWLGTEEVYANMLKDCFDISLSKQDSFNNGGICEVCITQLRNASNFKKQVQQTEQQFLKKIEDNGYQTSIIKVEVARPDDDDHDLFDDGNLSDGFSSPEYDIPLTKIKVEKLNETKPKKRAAKPSTSKAKKLKKEAGEPSAKRTDGVKKMRKTKTMHYSATPERGEHRVNLTAILQHSNASPFRDKTVRGFSCLYCAKYFQNIDDLRAHTAQPSEKSKINSMLDFKLSYNPIKVDITDLRCIVCDTAMKDLADLKDHLVKEHNKTIHQNIKDIILPFRLEDGRNFTCVICSVVHMSFKSLYHHMSSHYRNYCCSKCGEGYITIAALRKHDKTHYQGEFPCDYCDKTYSSLTKKRHHEKGVHTAGWMRNKCPHCPAIFVNYYDKSDHLVREHNMIPVVYPCNACDKKYKRKHELNRHIKHHHLQQRNHVCDKCTAKFFTKRSLRDHYLKHSGLEASCCDVCGKAFSRPRGLTNHMKIHQSDPIYQCDMCKRTFMQKRSLQCHIKLHQGDLEIFKEFDDVKHLIDDREMTLKEVAEENRRKAEAMKNYL
ncbi:zinc finger protein 668-like isoform X1 [Aricia agestis]|uniref:zinc finger protein 668-like isoform X1 n=1 Tax=Aricia agestis TaxID=91739 RepID=UPI001C207836|nr:zinc finger protein 668-like isoform X1 [Aricia agestis]